MKIQFVQNMHKLLMMEKTTIISFILSSQHQPAYKREFNIDALS